VRIFYGDFAFDVQRRNDGWYWRALTEGFEPLPWEPGPLPSIRIAYAVAVMTMFQRRSMASVVANEKDWPSQLPSTA
jgi:hypothetical protein